MPGPEAPVGYRQVSTTTDSREVATELARSAVQARLAACGQVSGPASSVYWWDGAVETAEEWLVLFKTTAACADALIAHVRAQHPYQVPEVISTPIVAGDPTYLAWISSQTRGPSHPGDAARPHGT